MIKRIHLIIFLVTTIIIADTPIDVFKATFVRNDDLWIKIGPRKGE
jgi:hypothetical protein